MSVLEIIHANLPSFSTVNREIARFILDEPEMMLRLSSGELGRKIGRSQSSVVKFSQKLGFESYQGLKLAVSEANVRSRLPTSGEIHGSIGRDDPYAVVAEKMVAAKCNSIRQTMLANGEATFVKAVAALAKARRISLAGVGASSLAATDFAHKLQKFGFVVAQHDDSHTQMANAAMLREGDVLVAFSHAGMSIETVRISEHARSRGATVIVVTGPLQSPLVALGDIVIRTSAPADEIRSSSITARDAQLVVGDLLFVLLIQRQPDAYDYIEASEAAVARLKEPG